MLNIQHLDRTIRESGKSKSFLAKKIGITKQSFSNKCTGRTSFTVPEFIALMKELGKTTVSELDELFDKD